MERISLRQANFIVTEGKGRKKWCGYKQYSIQFSCSVVSNSLRPHGLQHARLSCPSPTHRDYWSSCPSSWWCHPSISSSVIPFSGFNLSQHQDLFQWVSSLHQVAKYRSFSFSINPSNEYSGLISFRMDWLYLLAIHRTFKNLLQHHTSKALSLQCSAFYIVHLTSIHDYWKNHSFD